MPQLGSVHVSVITLAPCLIHMLRTMSDWDIQGVKTRAFSLQLYSSKKNEKDTAFRDVLKLSVRMLQGGGDVVRYTGEHANLPRLAFMASLK